MIKDMIESIATAIVDNESKVQVTEIPGENISILEVLVDKEDLGKMIGRRGKIVQSMRNIIFAAGFKTKKRYSLDISAHTK